MVKQWNLGEFTNLYRARDLLSKDNRQTLGLLMPVDVYVQDPHVAESDEALALNTIWVDCEPDLMDGPTSARFVVVENDPGAGAQAEPARWDRSKRRYYVEREGEQAPITRAHRALPQFHQLNAWAVAQSVLSMYEADWVLGRSAPWAFEGNRLQIVPHAGQRKNAFYDRRSQSLRLHYFDAAGRRIYTCLSHDIIAHEMGHAILDGLRPLYFEISSLQTAAFHEFVADLTAIMISLLNNELRWEVAEVSAGDLSRDTVVAALAEEFGHYAMGRSHLRSATNKATMDDVVTRISPYPWSEVLTGAMWDILSGMFAAYRTTPKSTGKLPSDREALLWAVNRFRRVAFQPLDYLPPMDVQFGDYARAVLRADALADPADAHGFRELMRGVFQKRGIDLPDEPDNPYFYAYDIDRLSRSRTDAYHFLHENRRQLCIPADQDIAVVDLYRTDKTVMGGGKLPREIVLQYAWRQDVPLNGPQFGALAGQIASLLCGGTLVLDERGNVLHWTRKPGYGAQTISAGRRRTYCGQEHKRGLRRRGQLRDYLAHCVAGGMIGLAEEIEADGDDAGPPIVAHRAEDGTLRFRTRSHLRHWGQDVEEPV
ncbi:MAG: serine protease [Anaerolineae bacterium]|nr:serine protease [Anaerolineae bacterium]